ncbi:MAG: AAA family ATPase [Chloroflexota bacterium]|nr:AAA family ATPase [Chloroflexota bacterium]
MDRQRGERKLATVLFADLIGSTALASAEDPERTRARLDSFYDAMAEQIQRAGGTLEKFIGDAVMAVFGVPAAQEDHAERALHAALWMQQSLDELFEGELALRIGVNTGEVVVGWARQGSSFVTGDTVNVAARLEQAAADGSILVGNRTVALVAGAFEFEELRQLEAKGKPAGIEGRRLLRALSLTRPRGVVGLGRAFVGRQREWQVLRNAYERTVESARPELVTIVGEAGVGKSRLVRELWEWLGRESPETLRRIGRCPPFGHARAYRPIAEILTEQFSLRDSDPPKRILQRLGRHQMLALALGLDVSGGRHPLDVRDRFQSAWLDLLSELAADRPLVLLIEDLHWSEEPLVELLEHTLREGRCPLLLLATARPEFLETRPTWGLGPARSHSLSLAPLQAVDVHRFLEQVVAAELPPAVHILLARAEGNPLFLEELLRTLLERGVLRPNGGVQLERLAEIGLPDTVQAVLASRIDLLPPTDKAALQSAAVIGRVFWPSAIRELLGGSEPNLGLLEQRDFVRRQAGSSLDGEAEYAFKHALTREVAYGSLTRRERAHLHADFAGWLEGRRGGRDAEASLVAHHYAEAVRPEDVDLAWRDEPDRHEALRASAVGWLRRAAQLAAGRHELQEAVALLERALALDLQDRVRIEILSEKADVLTIAYDVSGFRRAMEAALELRPERRVAARIFAMLSHYGLGRPYMWKEPPPREVAEHWLARALELSEPGSEARGFARLAEALSDPLHRVEAAEEAHAIGTALGIPRLVVSSMEARTFAATEADRYLEACEWADRALEAAPTLADPGYISHHYWNAGFVYLRAGRFRNAQRFAEEFDRLESSIAHNDPHGEVHAVALHALLASVMCRWKNLAELAGRAEVAASANEDFPCQFNWRVLLVCALGLAHLGEDREARRLEAIALRTAVVAGPAEREPSLLRLAILRGDGDRARQILENLPPTHGPWAVDTAAARFDALALLGEREGVEEEAAPYLDERSYTQPFALRALGLVHGDASLLHTAATRFEAMGLAWRADETRSLAAAQLQH